MTGFWFKRALVFPSPFFFTFHEFGVKNYPYNQRGVIVTVVDLTIIFLQEATEDSLKAEKRKLQREVCFLFLLSRLFFLHSKNVAIHARVLLSPNYLWLTDWRLTDWLTDWLTVWLTDCLSIWLTDCLSVCMSWLTDVFLIFVHFPFAAS